ncbi:MAG: Kazal-type serine protease inhibitor family protein [Chryseolinea sp.]
MKAIPFIFPLMLCFFSSHNPALPNDIESAIRASDFVGFVVFDNNESTDDYAVLHVVESFKGDEKDLTLKESKMKFEADLEYLLIANKTGSVIKEITYSITIVGDLSDASLDILNNLECYNEASKKKYEKSICHRNLDPVCGCDNKTYGNLCELSKAGIMKFKPGRCQ